MAALGIEDKGVVTTRGWYRVEPGKCLRPEVRGPQRRLYSFAEAVGADGQGGGPGNMRAARRRSDRLGRAKPCSARATSSSS